MKLSDKQAYFADLMLLLKLYCRLALGDEYRLRLSYAYRDERCNEAIGGHPRSTHVNRLAEDLVLDRRVNGSWVYQRRSDQYEVLGTFWEQLGEALDVKLRWGGRWGDGNHFSWEHGGIK